MRRSIDGTSHMNSGEDRPIIPGRVWFGGGNTFSVRLTARQRRNFLRFLNRHDQKRFLAFDDFHKKQSASISGT